MYCSGECLRGLFYNVDMYGIVHVLHFSISIVLTWEKEKKTESPNVIMPTMSTVDLFFVRSAALTPPWNTFTFSQIIHCNWDSAPYWLCWPLGWTLVACPALFRYMATLCYASAPCLLPVHEMAAHSALTAERSSWSRCRRDDEQVQLDGEWKTRGGEQRWGATQYKYFIALLSWIFSPLQL